MRLRYLFLVLLLSASTAFASSQCEPKEGAIYAANVVLQNHGHLSDEEAASVKLRVIGLCFDSSATDSLRQAVRSALHELGYSRAVVQNPVITVIDQTRRPNAANLTFDITEGQPFLVDTVTWSGGRAFTADQLEALTSLRPGDIFHPKEVGQTSRGVSRLYHVSGYPDAMVVPKISVGEDRIQVEFKITEGALHPN